MQIRYTAGKIRNIAILLLFGFCILGNGHTCYAAETGQNIYAAIEALKVKFPHGKYWNHVGSPVDNVDGYTSSPCTLHKVSGIHIEGTNGCTCNHFINSNHGGKTTQCMGFAYKLGYDVFGDTTWTKKTENPIANIRVGDIVRLGSDSHSAFVISISGNTITVAEANYPNSCIISWGRSVNLAATNVTYYERADNYDAVVSGTMTGPIAEYSDSAEQGKAETVQQDGWVHTSDGNASYYVENGVIQKNRWITVDKKKYYLDENGFYVTGFYNIGSYTYYFGSDGAAYIKRWFDVDQESYYANETGIVLKSQWLYKNNVKVYVTADGSVAKSEFVQIGNNTYYFNANGKRSKGFKQCGGKYYYCDKNGIIQKKKWITKSGKKYYLQKSGVRAQSKLLKIGKYSYYFNANGQMVKKKKIIYNSKIYKADKYGHCKFVQYAKMQD